MESKRDKFIRLAENRTNKIIDMIRLLGNCSNKSNYEFDDKDVNLIFETIKKELNDAREKFETTNKKNQEFKLR